MKSLEKLRRPQKNPSGPPNLLIVLEKVRSTPLDTRSGFDHLVLSLKTTDLLEAINPSHKEEDTLYSIVVINPSELYSEEFSSDDGSDPYSIVVRPIDAYSVVSLIAIVERGQGPVYSIVESQ